MKNRTLVSLLFGAAGITMEVAFTALTNYLRDRDAKLTGHSYLWMFPIYASTPFFLGKIYPRLSHLPVAARLGVYVPTLLAIEYCSGAVLRKTIGECPWEKGYYETKWGIDGLTRLDYAPAWAVACHIFELLYVNTSTPPSYILEPPVPRDSIRVPENIYDRPSHAHYQQ